jgi:hypothetical protein
MAKRMQRAVSVLAFQWISTVSPIVSGGPAAVEQGRFDGGHARAAAAGPAEHGDVVHAPQAAERSIVDGWSAAPAEAGTVGRRRIIAGGEGVERLAHAAREIRLVPVGGRDGDRHDGVGGDDVGEGGP